MNETLKSNFDSVFRDNICSVSKEEEVLQVYLGGLRSETVFSICSELETTLKHKKIQKVQVKRSFFLALEVIQNQLLHGSKDEGKNQYNYFTCTFNSEGLNIYAANLVKKAEVGSLTERINHVNHLLEEKTLRELYMQQLTNNEFGEKGGGGLGFIKMALVTGRKIGFDFHFENSDYAFLAIKLCLPCHCKDHLNDVSIEELLRLI